MLLFINIIGLTLLAIFLLILLNKQEKKTGDRLLLVIIVAFACYFLSEIWIQTDLNAWSFAFQSLFSFYTLCLKFELIPVDIDLFRIYIYVQ